MIELTSVRRKTSSTRKDLFLFCQGLLFSPVPEDTDSTMQNRERDGGKTVRIEIGGVSGDLLSVVQILHIVLEALGC